MKTFQLFETMPIHCDSGSRHDFPRLARESGFSFNLYRGRVDWSKIGAIDVDKIIRERDLETLQDALSSVMSCSLNSEYDLKVLDPNFVKIFQLAQLGADFLLYCRNYLDHCVTVMQEQLRVALQEIEYLQKLKQQNTEEVSALQKKLRARTKCNKSPTPCFKCSGCDKVFVGEQYLIAHQQRRHPGLLGSELIVNVQSKEVETLQQQVQELQNRLHATEDALRQKQDPLIPDVNALQAMLQSELQKMKAAPTTLSSEDPVCTEYSPPQQTQPVATSPKKLEAPEICLVDKNSVQTENEITKNEEPESPSEELVPKQDPIQSALLISVEQQSNEIRELKEQLKIQNQAHESVMQRKLEELQRQHQADLDNLKLSILNNRGSGDHISPPSAIVDSVTLTGSNHSSLQGKEIPQAWHKTGSKTESVSHERGALAAGNKDSHHMITKAATPTVEEARPLKSREESVIREEYVSPAEQDYSDSSSHSSSSSPVSPPQTDVKRKHVENQTVLNSENTKEFKAQETLPSSIKSMYDKSSSSNSASASETGSSSYDSESQSSNSDQEPSLKERELRVHLTPQVLGGLKEDLLNLLNRRLRELGVDPEWDKLPVASFHSNMATVKHHQNIAAKSHKNYFSIQEALSIEADKRVAERLKVQQSIPGSSKTKEKRTSGSFSIFARIKSHVKSRLSPGRSPHASKHPTKSGAKTGKLVENVYSQEPTSSHSKASNEYEVVPEKLTVPMGATESSSLAIPEKNNSEKSFPQNTDSVSKPATPVADVPQDDSDEKVSPGIGTGKTNVQVYGRSMYANLEKSDIEVHKRGSDLSIKQPSQLKTSTPIKSDSKPFSKPGSGKITFISSDIESISEVESDVRDILENTSSEKPSENPNEVLKPRPHTTLTTAELLANVAKFRESTGQLTSQLGVKSNLKSSHSTGNISKKKVVFRDEKDGFDTIELGPAHSSYESLTAHRSHSENSLVQTFSSSLLSNQPVPQPRSHLLASSTSAANSDSDDDWDWDKDSSDTLTMKKPEPDPTSVKRGLSFGDTKTTELTSISMNDKQKDAGSLEGRRVSDLVKDIEKNSQNLKERPLFGVNVLGPMHSGSYRRQSLSFRSNSSSGDPIVGNQVLGGFQGDKLSDLLLDDISSG